MFNRSLGQCRFNRHGGLIGLVKEQRLEISGFRWLVVAMCSFFTFM